MKRPSVESKIKRIPKKLLKGSFAQPVEFYPGSVAEVKLGASKANGGTRGKAVVIGGEKTPAFYLFEGSTRHSPVVAVDVFDMNVSLPKAVKMHVRDVLEDPAAWAQLAVDKFDADLLTIHLVSIDPLLGNTSPREASKTVEEVAQAVDVPLIIGGCGHAAKDMDVFEEIAQTFAGERLLFSSVTRDMDVERCAKFISKYGHAALAFTPMNLKLAKDLNHRLCEHLSREDIVMDLTTAALGYGLEYAFSNMEKARLSALNGDPELACPMCSGTTNAWAAREAWMEMSQEWEPRELRGPLWELTTALALLLAGVDLFMMMHPAAVRALKDVIKQLMGGHKEGFDKLPNWVSKRIQGQQGVQHG